MLKRKPKKALIISVYGLGIFIMTGCILLIVGSVNKFMENRFDYDYSLNNVFQSTYPVVKEKTSIVKPYLSADVKIGRYFYDFEGDTKEQEASLLYYENTYMQNSGVDYVSEKMFDIVSILSGTVVNVKKDELLGTIVQIKHDNDLISVYQGIENCTLKEGNTVNQNQVIGNSGLSKINPEYKSYIHFEIYHKGQLLDPENIYTLNIEDFH
ncbi:MAG: M23 family metallopeptidase [Bacilli bacterium]